MIEKLSPIVLLSLLFMAGAVWQPYDADLINLDNRHATPSIDNFLGTDHLGRDILSRMMVGAGHTLTVLFSIGLVSFGLGTLFGVAASFSKGAFSKAILQMADFVIIMPTLVFALSFTALFGLTPLNAGLALGMASWGPYAILTHSLSARVLAQPYVLSAKALGAGPAHILRYHVLPNILDTTLTYLAGDVGRNIINYAALAFIGLGADTSRPDWGAMIFEYRVFIFENPLLLLWPCLAIFLTALMLNVLLDPGQNLRSGPPYA
jgi:peptide/nickel transport system permease protein